MEEQPVLEDYRVPADTYTPKQIADVVPSDINGPWMKMSVVVGKHQIVPTPLIVGLVFQG